MNWKKYVDVSFIIVYGNFLLNSKELNLHRVVLQNIVKW